jgi:hypothetical protein
MGLQMMVWVSPIDVSSSLANRFGDLIIDTINDYIAATRLNSPAPGMDDHRFTVNIQKLFFGNAIFINLRRYDDQWISFSHALFSQKILFVFPTTASYIHFIQVHLYPVRNFR